MWMTLAPSASHSLAATTSSSIVTGSAGASRLDTSAPVGATVIRVCISRVLIDRRHRLADAQRRVDGHVLLDQGQCDLTQLVVAHRRADEPDRAPVERDRCALGG